MTLLTRRTLLPAALLFLINVCAVHAQSSNDRDDVLKAILARELPGAVPDRDARARIVVDSTMAKPCNDRVCDWYSTGSTMTSAVQAFVKDTLGSGVRDRDGAYYCDDVPARFCLFLKNAT